MFTLPTLDPALAGHPFRRTLPAHVLRPLPVYEPEVEAAMERETLEVRSREVDWKHIGLQDVKDFLIAYCACFMAVMAFIA
ncbi:MAG: hypothetical protein RIS94_2623 [Pseudomonadota bacterium]|jgi:hypothetical protein